MGASISKADQNSDEFRATVLPHVDAAYNLARWLTRDATDAEDVVQEAYLRALKFYGGFNGRDARAWILKIVRNTCYTWLQKNRGVSVEFDEIVHSEPISDPEAELVDRIDSRLLGELLAELPIEYREIVVLRELEDLSYKEIAEIANIPVGTVMSRLARGRERLQTGAARYKRAERS